ncbi:GNAT family N-acetyltransferase [Methylobacterium radiodurans]|uniref:GNAT family N-acetyltransferase n=1 Tax=Methylobacterium radiodurans TaxID=2202828 RepID=A0A2U8W0A6_9HYPH|nr:GNAT family N-acetyltransferase [Methylobacterium radiodurans]AWN38892.1 GNAT family N-acetyltransferase [Methylobacterium radiodurans]
MAARPASAGTEETAAHIVLRPARRADLDALVALEHAAFATDRAERRAIRHAIDSPTMSVVVALALEGGEEVLVGAAVLERRRASRIARLSSIAVSPARGGLGIGGTLLGAAEAEASARGCDRLRLEVRADNGAGIRLYERRGYTRFAVRPDYYEDGMEAWRYEKAL